MKVYHGGNSVTARQHCVVGHCYTGRRENVSAGVDFVTGLSYENYSILGCEADQSGTNTTLWKHVSSLNMEAVRLYETLVNFGQF
jgi:hypothetical protein